MCKEDTSVPPFYCTSLKCPLQILHFFLQIEGLWQPFDEQVYTDAIFPTFAQFIVSVSHFGNSCCISNFFFIIVIFVMVISDL